MRVVLISQYLFIYIFKTIGIGIAINSVGDTSSLGLIFLQYSIPILFSGALVNSVTDEPERVEDADADLDDAARIGKP